MSIDIESYRYYFQKNSLSPQKFANYVLETYFDKSPPKFPIDIFKMLTDFGIFYEFRELDKLEGAYSPDSTDYPAAVVINKKRPFQRQRFTAAHELCHHLKDYSSQIMCPFGRTDPIERYADSFAAELLMPTAYFIDEAKKLAKSNGYVDPEDAFSLCHIFGTSYQAVIYRLSKFNLIGFVPNQSFFRKAKASRLFTMFDESNLLEQILDSYTYFPQDNQSPLWISYKNELVFHDNRLEGLDVQLDKVSEMLTDIRLFGKGSSYYNEVVEKEALEVIGHSLVYEFVQNVKEIPDMYKLCELHKLLYSLTPFSDVMGKFRTVDNHISGSDIKTVHHTKIFQEMFLLDKDLTTLLTNIDRYSISSFVKEAIRIHHRITQIHPFIDGNGRSSRAYLNWILKLKCLPPIFIPYEVKEDYVNALSEADNWNFEPLFIFTLERLLEAFVSLNNELSLVVDSDYTVPTY